MNTATIHPFTKALADAKVTLSVLTRPTSVTTDKEGWKHYAWNVCLVINADSHPQKCSAGIPYRMGTAHAKDGRPTAPRVEDVISSMALDSSACNESFDDWCTTFGYDTDSRKALETYLACQNSGAELRKLLGKHFAAVVEAAQEW